MKKGFTLIELLAVIVILAIIALIATPIVLSIIDDSKESSMIRSAEGYLRAVEYEVAQAYVTSNRITEGTYNVLPNGNICIDGYSNNTCSGNILEIEYNNEGPISGLITFEDTKIVHYTLTYPSGITVVDGRVGDIEETTLTLAETIIKQAKDNNYYYETTPNFSMTTAAGEYGLYQAPDDLGISYYFRGDTEDNYVQFGTGKVNKVLYKIVLYGYFIGSYETQEECEEDEYIMKTEDAVDAYCKPIGNAWNLYEDLGVEELVTVYDSRIECENSAEYLSNFNEGNDFVCFGYEEGTVVDSSLYWRIVRINGDGTIRMIYVGNVSYVSDPLDSIDGYVGGELNAAVDDWYNSKLKTNYSKYIADSIFCDDRQVTKTYYFNDEGETVTESDATWFGYDYAPKTRLVTNKAPKLTCTQNKNTVSSSLGNGRLTNPIGLITADEVAMAGGVYNTNNTTYYLFPNAGSYWTMTPKEETDTLDQFVVKEKLSTVNIGSDVDEYGIRPVINLKADVKFTGDGSYDNPYVIVTE